MRIYIFILLITLVSRASASGFEFTGNCQTAYREMLELNFNSANVYLSKERSANPGNAAVSYIAHYIDFLRAFISEEEKDYLQLKNNFDNRIDFIEKKATGSPWMKMAKGEMLLQMALMKLKRKEYLTAGYYIRRSYKLLEENKEQFPGFLPILKPLGFFHAIIGAVPENYKWLSNLVGLKGTIAQGGGELSLLINKLEGDREMSFLRTETGFLKIFIATHLEKDYNEAFNVLEKINKTQPGRNPLYVFLHANTCVISGNAGEGLKILEAYEPQQGHYSLHYLDYLTGILKLNNLDFTAYQNLTRFTESFRGKSFIKSAYQKLAWISLLKNDTAGYRGFLDKAKTSGDDFTDEDKQAQKEALSDDPPNINLLRSRLLFDGGNYNAALTELAGKPTGNFTKFRDQLEYTYRLARIFDKKGQTAKAIQYYSTTYENGKRTEWYFAANSALNNGMLYELKGDTANALAWYKKCLELRDHEYQNSIDQKAESGLNRIQD